MKPLLPLSAALLALAAAPVAARSQDHAHDMSAHAGHAAPSRPAQPQATDADPHAGHHMQDDANPAAPDPHAGHDTPAVPAHGTGGTALPAGDAPAPDAPEANYADRVWGAAAMTGPRTLLRREHGGGSFSQVMIDLAEYQVRDGRDGFRWSGEAWFGGDVDRLVVKSEGAGAFGEGVEDAEVQALYSRAIGPYFNLQGGIRHDIGPGPSRSYATIGFEGLAPYWFELEGALFLSDKGDVLALLEGSYDQRITQRLIAQPRAELNFALRDVPASGIGSGLSDVELGLRLRYEIAREFAPYIGVSWDRRVGGSARYARLAGEDAETTSFVVGIRAWF